MKSLLTRFVPAFCVGVGLLAWPAQSGADITSSGSWFLTRSNTFANGVNYGVVDIVADSDAGTVTFTVTPFNVQPLYGSLENFGIQAFGFNPASDLGNWSIALPDGWYQVRGSFDGYGFFIVSEYGNGNSRQNPLVFTITLDDPSQADVNNFVGWSGGTAGEGNALFAAHVAGFGTDPGSHYIAAVPAPGAVLLAAMGLGLIGCGRSVFCRPSA